MTTIYCATCDIVYDSEKRSTKHPDHPYLPGSVGWFGKLALRLVTRNW